MAVALRDLERGDAQRHPTLRVVHGRPQLPPTPPGVYRVRRLLVLAVIVIAVISVGVAVRAVAFAEPPVHDRVEVTVVVQAGETLWDVARRYAPSNADRSAWVAELADRNAVDPGVIQPGTPIVVPVEGQRVLAAPQERAARQ